MGKLVAGVLVLAALASGVVIGRASEEPPEARSTPAVASQPAQGPDRRSVRRVLDWFLYAPESELPVKGILGGTMQATALGFPERFTGAKGEDFFVLLEDGHALVTFRYRMRTRRTWIHLDYRQGERLDGWGAWRSETQVWRYEGPSFELQEG